MNRIAALAVLVVVVVAVVWIANVVFGIGAPPPHTAVPPVTG